MNTLTLGFLYTVGMGWALCETCVTAGTGNWLPLIGFLTVFTVFFSVVGCLEVSDKTVNTMGSAVVLLMAATLLVYAIDSRTISPGVFVLKTISAIILAVASFFSLLSNLGKGSSAQHS